MHGREHLARDQPGEARASRLQDVCRVVWVLREHRPHRTRPYRRLGWPWRWSRADRDPGGKERFDSHSPSW